jgi:diacylglycerol kinase (ATP)
MSLKHLVFIINPHSGVDRNKAIEQAIKDGLDPKRYSYEVQHTTHAGHGTELASEAAAKGMYAVVAVGGDGSVNDVMKGLMGTQTAMAIIPKGSGNGMARTMQIPLNEKKAIEVINQGRTEMMDIGFANDRAFMSNAGVAFDAVISEQFAKSTKRGLAVYSWLVTKLLWTYKIREWHISIDGKKLKEKAFMVIVANGKEFGYNFQIAPDASWSDGLLDIVIVRKFPRLMGGLIALRAMKGNVTNSRYVKHYRAKEISIAHPDLEMMQVDGDAHPCSNRIHFSVKPGFQRVIVP